MARKLLATPNKKTLYMREWSRRRRQDPVFRQNQVEAQRRFYKKHSKTEEYRSASRRHHLKLKYGITQGDYDAMLFIQGGKCACCPATKSTDGRPLHVDHCHVTGRVRGLLCDNCNIVLGKVGESVFRLHVLASYLERH